MLSFIDVENFINNKTYYHKFYHTNNFEVYCFCPISIFNNIKIIIQSNKKESDYFLVGGFDIKKKKGMIRLYKIIYAKEYDKTKIEYIQDIISKNKKYKFNGPISCITQSNIDGKIIITCWDGNIYLFDYQDISKYLNYDEQVKEKIQFNKFFF